MTDVDDEGSNLRAALASGLADALNVDWPGDTRFGAAPGIAAYLMARPEVTAAIRRLQLDARAWGRPAQRVLDVGEVRLLRYMAEDLDVVGAARVSKNVLPEDASKGEASDHKLVAFLMTSGHGSPFEHTYFRWWVAAPIFVLREWHRHRIASINEQSGRYSQFAQEFHYPDHVRVQDPGNKQSSVVSDDAELFARWDEILRTSVAGSWDAYESAIAAGVAREMARMLLPLNLVSRMWWSVNARGLMNFLQLRNHPAAQWEIQEYARAMERDFAVIMPWTHAAFVASGRVAP